MSKEGSLEVTPTVAIPRWELEYRASRAGGAGGQHVNRTATRIELRWNVVESPSLSEAQRALLLAKLARRLDRNGRIRVVSDERRSQRQNREAAVERFIKVIASGLHVARPRKKTKPTRSSVERRLETKKRRAGTKATRSRVRGEE